MGTIAEKLEYLDETKTQIKNALISKGATIADDDTFRSYADKISQIKSNPNLQTRSVTITQSGVQTITPDTGYDALSSVEITTNIIATGQRSNTLSSDIGSRSITIPAAASSALIIAFAFTVGTENTLTPSATNGTIAIDTIVNSGSQWTSVDHGFRVQEIRYRLSNKKVGSSSTVTITTNQPYGYSGLCITAVWC